MIPESPDQLPEGICTVKLPVRMATRGLEFPAGSVVPCFATSQLKLIKQVENAADHLLAGLYAWAVQSQPRTPGHTQILAQLASAGYPMPARGGAPVMPLATLPVGGMLLCILEGNVAKASTEVLVNAANDQLSMGGGVAGAIRSHGGIELEVECRSHAPARMGEVVETGAGKLAARAIYHAVVIEYATMSRTDLSDVESSYQKALERAHEQKVASVTVPMLGCGVGQLSVPEVVASYVSVARQVAQAHKRGMLVLLMAYGDEDAARAAQALRDNADPGAVAREAEDFLKEAQKLLGYPEKK